MGAIENLKLKHVNEQYTSAQLNGDHGYKIIEAKNADKGTLLRSALSSVCSSLVALVVF